MGFIDAHVHVWTDDTGHYPLAAGYKPEDMKPKRFTPEDLFKRTKPAGVDRVVLIQMSYYTPAGQLSEKGNGFDKHKTLTEGLADLELWLEVEQTARPGSPPEQGRVGS
jgi:hypothetical protein